jgi:hypothetical protein
MTFTGELTPLEDRSETESLEGLHAARRALLPEYRMLRALHGPGGKWDARRKAMLEAMKIRARMDMTARAEKITESAVDAYGHADEQYVAFVEQGIADAARLVDLETAISEIEERIRNREIGQQVYGKEVSLR